MNLVWGDLSPFRQIGLEWWTDDTKHVVYILLDLLFVWFQEISHLIGSARTVWGDILSVYLDMLAPRRQLLLNWCLTPVKYYVWTQTSGIEQLHVVWKTKTKTKKKKKKHLVVHFKRCLGPINAPGKFPLYWHASDKATASRSSSTKTTITQTKTNKSLKTKTTNEATTTITTKKLSLSHSPQRSQPTAFE